MQEQGRRLAARTEAEIAGHLRMPRRFLDDILGGVTREGIVQIATRADGTNWYILKAGAMARIGAQLAETRDVSLADAAAALQPQTEDDGGDL